MSIIRTSCPIDGTVDLPEHAVFIDDTEDVYRFACPAACRSSIENPMDRKIRSLLRKAGVRTIEEIVLTAHVVLADDDKIDEAFGFGRYGPR